MMNINVHSPLYNFLIEAKFRWLRHILLIFSIGLIITHDINALYKGQTDIVNMYVVFGTCLAIYLLFIYLNIYWSIPKLLLEKKYVESVLILLATSFFISIGIFASEYCTHKFYEISDSTSPAPLFFNERHPIVKILYGFLSTAFYLICISSAVFYKHWMLNIKKIEQLKTEQFNSEVNNLKSRISPDFLLDKLHRAAGYCLTNPGQTSRILFQLSRILRYQLYDLGREKVLLSSELKYINGFLTLQKECNDNFDFKIVYPESKINYLIPPLLLISLVEESLRKLSEQEEQAWIHIDLGVNEEILTFSVTDNRIITDIQDDADRLSSMHRRLELIQAQEYYHISSVPDKYSNRYKTIFQYRL